MKKLKMWLNMGQTTSFIHNGNTYNIDVLPHDGVPVLKGWNLPAEYIIRIRKKTKYMSLETVTDYFVFHMYGKRGSDYFQIGKDEFLRFKRSYDKEGVVQLTIFTSKVNEANGYALFIQRQKFGIKAINDRKYEGAVDCGELFYFDGENFQLKLDSITNQIYFEYFERNVDAIIEINTNGRGSGDISSKVLPHKTTGCTANAFEKRSRSEHKFFNSNNVCEFVDNPSFVESLLKEYDGKYYAMTMESRIIGELKLRRIDSYIFKTDEYIDKVHPIRYQEGFQFMHFTDYAYHIRYESEPMSNHATVKVFVNSEIIMQTEIEYEANTINKLEKLPQKAKNEISEAIKAHESAS